MSNEATEGPQKRTFRELAEEILAESGVPAETVPHVAAFIDAGGNVWKLMEPVPLPQEKENLVIVSIFRDGDDANVYCAPTEKGKKSSLTRFVVSRVAKSMLVEGMSSTVFRELIVEEFRGLYGTTNPADAERGVILEYMRTLPNDYPMLELISDIEELVHQDGEVEGPTPGDPKAPGADATPPS